ncbi:LytR/AlgR family response regulator transcription factor [Flavivirga spongiicola]|uniref:Response regulator transcription factor n=1 Tax=Flavivirga spongiicola TaxID=421621 RepID=A0ABU7XTR0_9FLAO|nr:response regulator transcription factor [Flavivirga sp. MEBiC05379]MDO5979176.1 response regulator transcription factor [Flavivirga sp. MEBiC05379]
MLRSCIIIEDQPPAQRLLQKYIKDMGSLELKGTFSSAIEAIAFLEETTVDLIFLDIHLPKISGMDFLKTQLNRSQVILTTAFSDYALESYEYNVVDYLLKPFSFQRFVQAVTKSASMSRIPKEVTKSQEKTRTNTFFIKSGHDLLKVSSKDVLYIKSDDDYTEVVTANKTYLSTDSLKGWLGKLGNSFCQVHKSYILNTTYLQKVSGNQIFLNNEKIIPIGRAYKDSFLRNFLK